MEFANLISIVKENSDYLAYTWFEQILDSSHFKSFKKLSHEKILESGKKIFEQFGIWLEKEENSIELEKIGFTYYMDNFSLDEIIESVFVAKSISLNYLLLENPITSSSSIGFIAVINEYFDHLLSHVTHGFTIAIYHKLKTDEKYSDEELKKLFHISSIESKSSLLFDDILEKGLNRGILK